MKNASMRAALAMCFLICSAAVAADPPGAGTQEAMNRGCGALAVRIAVQRGDRRALAQHEVEAVVDPDGDGMCSVADLVRGFDAFGVDAEPMVSDARVLPQALCVLLIRTNEKTHRPDHFAAMEPGPGGQYMVYMPPDGLASVTGTHLVDRWEGVFLRLRFRSERASEFLPACGWGAGAGVAAFVIVVAARRARSSWVR